MSRILVVLLGLATVLTSEATTLVVNGSAERNSVGNWTPSNWKAATQADIDAGSATGAAKADATAVLSSIIADSDYPSNYTVDGQTKNYSVGVASGVATFQKEFDAAVRYINFSVTWPGIEGGIPEITSLTSASGSAGDLFSYTITATNQPTAFTATGLPTGLTINGATGVISGTLAAVGQWTITLGASNVNGADSETLTLTIGAHHENGWYKTSMVAELTAGSWSLNWQSLATAEINGSAAPQAAKDHALAVLASITSDAGAAFSQSLYAGDQTYTNGVATGTAHFESEDPGYRLIDFSITWPDHLIPATFTFSNLSHSYDGSTKTATVSVSPTAATYTYDLTRGPAAGSYTVTATATGAYEGSGSATLTIGKKNQTITFTTQSSATVGTVLTLSANASSGLPVTFSVSGPATLSGTQLAITGEGTVQVTASQAGDADWSAASSVTRNINAGMSSGDGDNDLVTIGAVERPVATGTTLVAALDGKLSVDNKGAANYTIPLRIPPGRAELQPSLALTYNSQAGNGVMGVGWSLSTGFPQAIVRGRSILARDGVVRGVNFDADDKFYLDGKRLICVSGTNGQPGSIYRTEVDSFLTIEATGSSVIDTFTATDKSGTCFIFGKQGTTSDAYQKAGGETTELAYAYGLKRVVDAVGNYVEFSYGYLGGGEHVLNKIEYTLGSSIEAGGRVEFAYESRSDAGKTFVAGRSLRHRARLALITASSRAGEAFATTSDYSLVYEYAPNQGRSRLKSVSPRLRDPMSDVLQPLPATSFRWTDNSKSTASQANAFTFPSATDFPGINDWENMVVFGDFNGDGKHDCAVWDSASNGGIKVKLSTGSTWTEATVWLTNATIETLLPDFQIGTTTGTGLHLAAGDFDGDGVTDLLLYDGSFTKLYIARSTRERFAGLGGASDPSLAADVTDRFSDPSMPPWVVGGRSLLSVEGVGACSRVTVADFTGDGRDDIVLSPYDGYLYLYRATGTGLAAPDGASSPQVAGAGSAREIHDFFPYQVLGTAYDLGPNVRVMPADLNGDGRMDYVALQTTHQAGMNFEGTTPFYFGMRSLKACLALADGTFSPPTTIWSPLPFPINPNAANPIKREEVGLGVMPGDFNGDGLTDYLVTIYLPNTGGVSWQLNLSTGGADTEGRPAFKNHAFVLPNVVTINAGAANAEIVSTLSQVIPLSAWNGWLSKPEYFLRRPGNVAPNTPASTIQAFHAVESGSMFNTYAMDVNDDGLTDLVWYVDKVADESATAAGAGWWAMLATGSFTGGVPNGATGTGFVGPVSVPNSLMGGAPGAALTGSTMYFTSTRHSWDGDCDGDGHPDLFGRVNVSGRTTGFQPLRLTRGLNTTVAAVFPDVVDKITNGLGSETTVNYQAAKHDAIYLSGAAVSYPIRELRANTPVVGDVYHDSGGSSAAHFSYQYSGRRLDLSGRGDLGFHAFVTLDHQTNLFKYQFLTQSFPMTGLTAREETYRYLGDGKFRFISSHDNTVVFDEVVKSPTDSAPWGTVYPFISKAIESRWENSDTAHFTLTAGGPSSQPEGLFSTVKPEGAHITISAESRFDGQTSAQLDLPGSFNPSDTVNVAATETVPAHRENQVIGVLSFGDITSLEFPRKIYYGNLRQLETDFGGGYGERVVTDYFDATGGLTGLVKLVQTSVWGGGYGTKETPESAPEKTFTYWTKGTAPNAAATPLVETETINAEGSEYDLKTIYKRDSRGRVEKTTLDGYTSQGSSQHIGSYVTSESTDFDDRFDLPTETKNAEPYSHTTTIDYHDLLGLPELVTDPNNVKTQTTYDALGRTKEVHDQLRDLKTTTSYAFDTDQTVSPPTADFDSATYGTPLSLTSAYKVTVSATAQPSVTTYYDRLGRPIRVVKDGYGTQTATTDTIYNVLGQVVAISNPYASGTSAADRLWTKTSYDPLGRVKTVIAPNGTTTTTTYSGRATTVSVDAAAIDSIDPAAQSNTTLVDAKGRTVKVWNADNDPGTLDATTGGENTASIEFKLDGFGRMRETILKGQTAHITAKYDPLGRQKELNDPDKGLWKYTNNALGQVVTQEDAIGNITTSTFDHLGRPLTRTTAKTGTPTETAEWFYYDTQDYSPPADDATHRAPKGTRGWIGALQRATTSTTGAPGYAATHSTTETLHYYDSKGRPEVVLNQIDDKWFYTHTTYDDYSRADKVTYFWRPPGHEAAGDLPYLWNSYGLDYDYDSQSHVTKISDTSPTARVWWQASSDDGYDHLDRPVKFRKGAAHWTQRSYRASDGILESIKTGPTLGATSIQNLSFGFDGLGNLRSRSDGTSLSETFNYDVLNRLTKRGGTDIVTYETGGSGNIASKVAVTATGYSTLSDAYVYGGSQPHAVTSAWGYTYAYDDNGNLTSRTKANDNSSLTWTGFDKPRWMARTMTTGSGAAAVTTTTGSEFLYNAARSRVAHLEFDAVDANGAPSHYTKKKLYVAGAAMEVDYRNLALPDATAPAWKHDQIRIYVTAPDGTAGAMEIFPAGTAGGTERAHVYHNDHLGSIAAITPYGDATTTFSKDWAQLTTRYSYDPWGQRRDPVDWANGSPETTAQGGDSDLTPRGFTGHEMLDDLGLVHMNGRIYDPLLGRMLSADILVQAPDNLQAYNRYSYVFNNPLSYTDPSGFKTISDYEKEKEKARSNIRDLIGQVKAGKISLTDFVTKAYGEGRIVVNSNDAIRHIEGVAQGLSKIADMKVDARQLDDVDPTFKAADALTTGMKVVPGLAAGNEASKGNYGTATKEYAKDVALTLIGMRIGKWLNSIGSAEGKVASEVVEEAAEQTAKASANGPAANRAAFETYKDTLRAEMSRPPASNPELNALLDELYRPNAKIGSGSTAAAVRQEMATGQTVGGKMHTQKAQDMIVALQRWLTNNASASSMDRAAAQNVIKDMQNALGGKP